MEMVGTDPSVHAGARKIEHRSVEALIPFANNARMHSEAQVALIAGSIRQFGFNNPVLVDGNNGIIAGHGRVLAARKLGLDAVPVIELAHLSETQKRAYILADNRLAEAAGWDRELLALELGDLADLDVDLGTLGFEALELDGLFNAGAADLREEDTPDERAAPSPVNGMLVGARCNWRRGWRTGSHAGTLMRCSSTMVVSVEVSLTDCISSGSARCRV